MSEQDNVRIARATFEALNAKEMDRWEALSTSDSQNEQPGAAGPMNREQARMYIEGFQVAFPDLHFDVMREIAQGDYVVLHWVGTGTHTGPMRTPTGGTIPPTGKQGRVPGSTTYEIKNGKITRSWAFWDMAGLLAQLGLLPSM